MVYVMLDVSFLDVISRGWSSSGRCTVECGAFSMFRGPMGRFWMLYDLDSRFSDVVWPDGALFRCPPTQCVVFWMFYGSMGRAMGVVRYAIIPTEH